jgi:hypothetical protein
MNIESDANFERKFKADAEIVVYIDLWLIVCIS